MVNAICMAFIYLFILFNVLISLTSYSFRYEYHSVELFLK